MTQMRYLLFVVIGLIGCFPLRAQTPEDNLRDEEYYPFQNGYEEPYSPMIDTDSSLFYRAIQRTCSGTPRTSNSHSWPTTAAENRTGPTGCR